MAFHTTTYGMPVHSTSIPMTPAYLALRRWRGSLLTHTLRDTDEHTGNEHHPQDHTWHIWHWLHTQLSRWRGIPFCC